MTPCVRTLAPAPLKVRLASRLLSSRVSLPLLEGETQAAVLLSYLTDRADDRMAWEYSEGLPHLTHI